MIEPSTYEHCQGQARNPKRRRDFYPSLGRSVLIVVTRLFPVGLGKRRCLDSFNPSLRDEGLTFQSLIAYLNALLYLSFGFRSFPHAVYFSLPHVASRNIQPWTNSIAALMMTWKNTTNHIANSSTFPSASTLRPQTRSVGSSSRGYNNQHTTRSLSDLNPDDCRAFCWKDCAIYGHAGLTGQGAFDLLDQVYQEWFPHRARDKDVSDRSFFGKSMEFKRRVSNLEEILRFHRSLCRRLQALEADVPDRELYAPFHVKPDGRRRVRPFQLRPTLLSVFIALNKGWQEHGVLLVCNTESTASKLGIEDGKDDITSYEVTDGSDLGEARVLHCPLKRAMKAVVSRDKERARKRTEYNEMFDEIYGSEDEV